MNNNNKYEHFYNIVPYKFRLDIAKCLTGPCAINKAYDYYKYCDNISFLHFPQKGLKVVSIIVFKI